MNAMTTVMDAADELLTKLLEEPQFAQFYKQLDTPTKKILYRNVLREVVRYNRQLLTKGATQ